MSDDSDIRNKAASSSESSDNARPLESNKRRRKQLETSSDSEDSDIEFINNLRRKKKLVQIPSSDDDSSDSETEEIVAFRGRRPPQILSDYESGHSSGEGNDSRSSSDSEANKHASTNKVDGSFSESSDADEQSERCPICLMKFKTQEIGSLETCDHCFCVACIQEWAKNAPTCPVDRQPFTLILVRQNLEGKVIRQIPVSTPTENPVIEEDATSCEVCGQSDREDRMLLCDWCDHGYHMECLNPPLEYVPIDEWYCPECSPALEVARFARHPELNVEEQSDGEENVLPYRPARRMVPRTRQSERVRFSLRHTRQQGNLQQPSISSGVESMEGETRPMPRQRRTKRKKRKSRFRIKKIVTDDGVIEVILKRKGKAGKRRKRRTVRATPLTVKGRLASKLGMCAPRVTDQMIPETLNRPSVASAPINHQRHQAGIPTLDIFGRRDQLEYFSGSDGEDEIGSQEGGVGLISRTRVARPSDRHLTLKKAASVLNSTIQRKPMKIEPIPSSASGNLLDSILDSQTLWHSKRTEIKSKSDGSLQVVLPKSSSKITVKEENKIDVRKATAPVIQTPMFPSGKSNTGTYNPSNSNRGGQTHSGSRSNMDQSYEGRSASSAGSGTNSSSAPSPLRGITPIRFRMNLPPRRPNIHSYPSDNIPPPPPLRLRSPLTEISFPVTNSPESSPPRDEEEIDIYSDIEQGNSTNNEGEEKSFGALEPPPEPPFLMTMEPPPEPPALLMTLNDDPSDDEATGLVIADEPAGDAYDPCADNSDDSSNEDRPLARPPEVPVSLVNPELVANYSSDSATEASSYNPELPTYQSTPIIGPIPRPSSHNSSEPEDDDEECPNFSMYSAASMSLAHRGKSVPLMDLDIPIPPPVEEKSNLIDSNIPLPDSPKSIKNGDDLDIPIPTNVRIKSPDITDKMSESSENQKDIEKLTDIDSNNKSEEDIEGSGGKNSPSDNDLDEDDDEEDDDDEDDDDDDDDEGEEDHDDENRVNDGNESDCNNSVKGEEDKSVKSVVSKVKGLSETADDECSTQGDVLDLAIEPETNLENNIHHDENDELNEKRIAKSLVDTEIDDKNVDGGDKSDGLVDITDEEMSVYDCQDNADLDKLDDPILENTENNQNCDKSLYSDDDNSLVGGATSAVSGGTLNNSDNVQPQTLPGLEGLETETISESEDVNFDELPLEGSEPPEMVVDEEEHSSTRKKKKKKNRKTSHTDEDGGPKGSNEPLEFEEGEIVEDKPKQIPKKDKKIKSKPENNVVKGEENINIIKTNVPEKESTEKKTKKKKDKGTATKDKIDKHKDLKEKTLKPGQADENISWKKLSKSTKDRNYRDGKEKDDKDRDLENKDESTSKKDKRNREKRKELERYNVRRLISEKPKRPKKDEFGRDISPSKSGSSLSPYRPPRYRSPLRTRNRSRTRSRSWKSRSRSRGRRRRSRSRDRVRSRKSRSRDRSRRSRSKNKASSRSRDRRRTKTPERVDRVRNNRSFSKSRRRSRTPSFPSRKYRSYSRSWSPSWSRSSISRSRSPRTRRRSRSISRSKSKSWTREQNITSLRSKRPKDPPKNLTVIVTNKDALKKKEKKKISKKKDDLRKKKHNQSPAPSKEVFTSGDNILVSVNFKNANKTPELIPVSTPLLRESSKRKRDEIDSSARKKKSSSSKKTPGAKKSNRLTKINEAARNAKPVAIIDLDLSPFREVDLSPKEVIVLSDSGDEGEKQRSEMQDEMDQLGHSGINQSMLSLVSNDHKQKSAMSQPESPLSTSFMLNSSGPKTPPEPHIKFSISTKPSQVRMLSNPLMEADEELHDEENIEDVNEILHKGPNTPPEPPPDLNTPASPPTTPYDPFDPTKSRSPSPQPRSSDVSSQQNTSREDKLDNILIENDESSHLAETKTSSPTKELEDLKKTPEPAKVHSTPKSDPIFPDLSPKTSPTAGLSEANKLSEDTLMKPIQKLLANANKLDVTVHKSPEKLVTVVISQQQVKSANQTPKQAVQPMKPITPNKHQTPKGNPKHQLFSSSLVKQVPILGALSLLPGPPVYTPLGLNSTSKTTTGRTQQNGDHSDDMDIDPSSPYSPGSSEGDDLFEPPIATPPRTSSKPITKPKPASGSKFDALFGSSPAKPRHGKHSSSKTLKKGMKPKSKGNKKEEIKVKLDEDQLKILDELPSSAVEMQVKDKFLKKLNRQERVVEEVKLVLKPHYAKKHVTKEEYKEILRRSVPKICHNKSGEINPIKIQFLIEAYVKKFRYAKKKASGALPASTQNKPKTQKALWS